MIHNNLNNIQLNIIRKNATGAATEVAIKYRISRTIRRTSFPEKCDLKSTCILYAEGKYLFPILWVSLHLLYDIFIMR